MKDLQAEEAVQAKSIPSVDAVNILRLAANNKEFTEEDYQGFKKGVFDDCLDGKEIKKQVGLRLRSLREEEDPEKVRSQRRSQTIRRLVGTLKSLEKELSLAHLVSEKVSKELKHLLGSLEAEIV